MYFKRSASASLLAPQAPTKTEPDHIQYLAHLEAENERLCEALERVKAQLCNDRCATRVRNALEIIDEALDDA